MINDAQGSHTRQLLLGLLFIVFLLAARPRVPNTSEEKSGESLAAPFLATRDYQRRLRDQKVAKSQFDVRSIEEWERSVVSIGRHDPGIGKFCWYGIALGAVVSCMCLVRQVHELQRFSIVTRAGVHAVKDMLDANHPPGASQPPDERAPAIGFAPLLPTTTWSESG